MRLKHLLFDTVLHGWIFICMMATLVSHDYFLGFSMIWTDFDLVQYIYVYIDIYTYIYTQIHIYVYNIYIFIYIYIHSQIPMGFRAAESIWLTYHSLYNADFRLAPSQWETSLQSNTVILTKLQRPLDTMGLFRCHQMLSTPTGILLMIVILYIRCSSDPCKTPVG